MREKREKQLKIILTVLKFVVLIFIIIGIPLLIYLKNPEIIENFKSLNAVNAMLYEHETSSIFVYIGIQIFQIVVSVIPGQAIQFAAGYAYNFWLAYIFSIIGIGLGTLATFYLSKLLGRDFIHLIFGEARINRHIERFKSRKAFFVLFILFLIPGIPKDMLTYAAGVSEIRFIPFLIINLTARTPALMCTILMGSFFRNHSYTGMYILIAAALVLFVLGIIFRERLFRSLDRFYAGTMSK